MIDVMVAQLTRMEAESPRYLERVRSRFDPKLPVMKNFVPRDQLFVWMQWMTGERMLERITAIIIEIEERDQFDHTGMTDPKRRAKCGMECPHARDEGIYERKLFYLGVELLFCEDCNCLIKEAMLQDHSYGTTTALKLEIEAQLKRWRQNRDLKKIDYDGLPHRPKLKSYGAEKRASHPQFDPDSSVSPVLAFYNPGGHGTIRAKL